MPSKIELPLLCFAGLLIEAECVRGARAVTRSTLLPLPQRRTRAPPAASTRARARRAATPGGPPLCSSAARVRGTQARLASLLPSADRLGWYAFMLNGLFPIWSLKQIRRVTRAQWSWQTKRTPLQCRGRRTARRCRTTARPARSCRRWCRAQTWSASGSATRRVAPIIHCALSPKTLPLCAFAPPLRCSL